MIKNNTKKISFNNLGKYGRLGNCMFQIAAVLGASRASGHKPICNLSGVPLITECFNINSIEDSINIPEKIYKEQDFSFKPQLLNLPPNFDIDLIGYFQSEKYFKHVQEEIRDNFKFKENIIKTAKKIIGNNKTCVSVHVRRTDYSNIQTYHPCLSMDYYRKALNMLPNHYPIFLSDDIDWCKESFKDLDAMFVDTPIDISTNNNKPSDLSAYIDMCVMSLCQAHIIANSSFSWWGAWLGREKTIAPKTWFGPDGPQDWQDIYCKDWFIL